MPADSEPTGNKDRGAEPSSKRPQSDLGLSRENEEPGAGADPEVVNCNRPEDILALRNGLLNLVTGGLLSCMPEFFTMNAADYDFDPLAKAPRWEKFVTEILPYNTEAQDTLQELTGYTVTADTSQQKMVALIGKKAVWQRHYCLCLGTADRSRECKHTAYSG